MSFSFSSFVSFLAIFQVLHCLCVILHLFQFSRHNPGLMVCISHFSRFSVFPAILRVLTCEFLIFLLWQCVCLIFHVSQFSRPNPGSTVCISYISCFSLFLDKFHILQCVFFNLHDFQFFFSIFHVLPREFLMFLISQFSRHNPDPKVCISHFSRISVILAILQILQCLFLILQVFQCFSPYFMS